MVIKSEGDEALTKIILDNLKLVKYATTGLRQSNPHLHDDIISEGNLALVTAARNVFKSKLKGEEAKRYLAQSIRNRVMSFVMESSTIVKSPRRPDLRSKIGQVYSIDMPLNTSRQHKLENIIKVRDTGIMESIADNEITEQNYDDFELTDDEKEIAKLLVDGYNHEEIAQILECGWWIISGKVLKMREKIKRIIKNG